MNGDKHRGGIALLLGAPEDPDSGDEARGAARMALKSFFKSASAGNWDKALDAFMELQDCCDDMAGGDEAETEEEPEEEDSEDY